MWNNSGPNFALIRKIGILGKKQIYSLLRRLIDQNRAWLKQLLSLISKQESFVLFVPGANFTLSSPRSLFATFISENFYNKLRAFIIG